MKQQTRLFIESVIVAGLLCGAAPSAWAAVFTSNVSPSGNWGAAGSWTKNSGTDGDGIPDSDDTVTIAAGDEIIVAAAAAASSVTSVDGTLTINSGQTLTLSGGATNLITISSTGILDVHGTLTLSNNGGRFSNAGTVTDAESCAINVAGTWVNSGTYVFDVCTVTLNRTSGGAMSIGSSGGTFFNLTLNNAAGTDASDDIFASDALNVDGTLTVVDGEFDISISTGNVSVAGDWTIQAAGSFTAGSIGVTLDGTSDTSDQNVTSNGQSFYDLTITNAGAVNPQDALVVTNKLTVSGGTLAIGTQSVTVGTSATNGHLVGAGAITQTSGTVTLIGAGNLGGTSAAVAGTCSGTNGSFQFYNLTLGDALNTKTSYLCGNVTVTHVLNIVTNQTMDGGSATLTFSGTGTPITRSGTLTANASTIIYTSSSGITALSTTAMTGSNAFYNLTINGTGTFTAGVAVAATNTLTVSSGTLAMGTRDLTVGTGTASGHIVGAGAIEQTSGTVTLQGSGNLGGTSAAAAGTCSGTNGSFQFYNLTAGDASNTKTTSACGDVTVSNDFMIAASQIFDANSKTVTLSGTDGSPFTVNGTFTADTGEIKYTGVYASGSTTVTATTYYTLTLSATETFVPGGTIIANNLLTVDTGVTFVLGTNTLTVGTGTANGHIVGAGAISQAASGTTTMKGAGNLGGTSAAAAGTCSGTNGSFQFYNLTAGDASNTKTTSACGDITVSNDFTIAASQTFDANTYTVTLSGTDGSPFTVNGTLTEDAGTFAYTGNYGSGNTTVTAETYNDLTFNNASETFAAGGTIAVGDDVTVTAGIYDMVTQNMTVGGDITVANSATFKATWVGGGTLTFSGGTASVQVGGAGTMGSTHTTIALGKTVTLAGNWTVQGNLTRTGTLDLASYTMTHFNDGGPMSGAGTFTAGTGSTYVPCIWNAATITLQALTYYNLKPSNCFTAGTDRIFSIQTGTVMNGSLSVNGARANLAGTITVAGALNVGTNSATSQMDLGSASVSVGGNVAVYSGATLTPGTSTVTLNGTADQSITSTTEAFNNLIVNNTGIAGSDDITLGDALTVNSTLTVTDGAFAIGGTTATAAAVTINGGALSLATSGGKLKLSGSGTLAMSSGSLTTADVATMVEITTSDTGTPTYVGVNLTGGTLTVPELTVDYLDSNGFRIGSGVTLTQFDGVRWGDSSNVWHGQAATGEILLDITSQTKNLLNQVFPTTWAGFGASDCNVRSQTSGVVSVWDWTGGYGGEENDCDTSGGEVMWKGGIGSAPNSAAGAYPAIY